MVISAAKLTVSTTNTLNAYINPQKYAILKLLNFQEWLTAYFMLLSPCVNSPLSVTCNTIPHIKRANTINESVGYALQSESGPYIISDITSEASIP